jgi:dephospho-CoA kinase
MKPAGAPRHDSAPASTRGGWPVVQRGGSVPDDVGRYRAAMILVGLTGGIGSGKSSVSALLAGHGAVIIDADAITRELQTPGAPLVLALVERFGKSIVDADGALVRQALADVVFTDPAALADLNKIVHPAVGAEMNRRIEAEIEGDRVVVLDVPLLAENPREGMAGVIVVDCPTEVAVERLVSQRSVREDDARARIARQATREQRMAIASKVIDNSGDRSTLAGQVEQVWGWLKTLPATTTDDLVRYRKRPTA